MVIPLTRPRTPREHRQAPVRRKPTGPELMFYLWLSAGIITAYILLLLSTQLLQLPAPTPSPPR
ncbi:hypothetical protein [Streptomyces sp. MST-110588]|uniref:hypothetical protein n=1 Tax=Streptomyces sp. MST-110588 TaxID=2833628 RepID=UPI001F5CD8B7|nr:hypothetical protein [Streptomyces sp. MST-110588]UNO41224.1 hypothetical protein KGS77_18655 [Streptomyces sp. MST-110588]